MTSNRYEPLVLLGAGGSYEIWMGVLHGAAGFRKPVVLKRAAVSVHEDLKEAERLLVAEGHLSAALSHPNLIHVYELVELPEGVMLAMEYLSGFSLHVLVSTLAADGGRIPWPVSARIVADAARGLDYAHHARDAAGRPLRVVHRDVTPENLVVTDQGITKVLDFGVARSSLREPSQTLTVKGKIGYHSPEQARGEPLDERSDLFSLGTVLHELLASRRLFLRDDFPSTLKALMAAPIPELPREVPPVVRDLVRRMLVREVSRRQITSAEVADTLEVVAASQGGSHQDVAEFLRAELGTQLERREKLVRGLLERPVLQPTSPNEPELTNTMTIMEAALDRTFSDAVTPSIPDEDDTWVDPWPPGRR